MKRGNHIVLLDPALADNQGTISSNLGDQVISERVISILGELFPGKEIIRVSSHDFLSTEHQKLINSSQFSFIGGTNLLYSDMLTYRQIGLRRGRLLWLFPGFKNLILLGCGWGPDYNNKLTRRTSMLYNNILHPGYFHSVRDRFTSAKLESGTKRKTINTSCPSMWNLAPIDPNLEQLESECLFSLTDYRMDKDHDEKLLRILLDRFSTIHFFPQGKGDLDYLTSLDTYKVNKNKISLLPHDYSIFKEFIRAKSFVYIGTRLHGGIKCLETGKKALIIAVDNRAMEIGKDTGLPVMRRSDLDNIKNWLDKKPVFEKKLEIPVEKIEQWRKQFK